MFNFVKNRTAFFANLGDALAEKKENQLFSWGRPINYDIDMGYHRQLSSHNCKTRGTQT